MLGRCWILGEMHKLERRSSLGRIWGEEKPFNLTEDWGNEEVGLESTMKMDAPCSKHALDLRRGCGRRFIAVHIITRVELGWNRFEIVSMISEKCSLFMCHRNSAWTTGRLQTNWGFRARQESRPFIKRKKGISRSLCCSPFPTSVSSRNRFQSLPRSNVYERAIQWTPFNSGIHQGEHRHSHEWIHILHEE